jgi:hypothetical protein
LILQILSKQITRSNVLHPKLGGYFFRLRTFARARGANEHEVHAKLSFYLIVMMFPLTKSERLNKIRLVA